MVAAPPHHPSIARALGPVAATMRAALEELDAGAASGPARASAQGTVRRVVVAVSGGADSMATMGLLELLRRRLAITLVVAHVDHGLREGSCAEAEFVVATARVRGHGVCRSRVTIDPGPGLPARARAARRDALLGVAAEVDADIVVLGHTMTDQVETVLLNLCRGAGLAGLGGMRPWQPWTKPSPGPRRRALQGLWVRPMMQLTREQTRDLAQRLALPFVDDPGNDDDTQPRVRLRRRVLPELLAINSGALGHVAASASIARESAILVRPDTPTTPARSMRALPELPAARQRTAILALCRDAGLPPDAVAARTLDGIIAALAEDAPHRPHRWDLRGAVLRLEAGHAWIEPTAPQAEPTAPQAEAASQQPLTHPTTAAILPEPGRNA